MTTSAHPHVRPALLDARRALSEAAARVPLALDASPRTLLALDGRPMQTGTSGEQGHYFTAQDGKVCFIPDKSGFVPAHLRAGDAEAKRFSRAGIEKALVDHHNATHDTVGEQAEWDAAGRGHSQTTFHKALPAEVNRYLEGSPAARRLFHVTDEAGQAGGSDALSDLGEDRYFEHVDRLHGSNLGAAKRTAATSADPEVSFLNAVHSAIPTGETRAGLRQKATKLRAKAAQVPAGRAREAVLAKADDHDRRASTADAGGIVAVKPGELRVGTQFTTHGVKFRVAEDADGLRVLQHGADYGESTPLDALRSVPVDAGSFRQGRVRQGDAHENAGRVKVGKARSPVDDIPFSAGPVPLDAITLAAETTGKQGDAGRYRDVDGRTVFFVDSSPDASPATRAAYHRQQARGHRFLAEKIGDRADAHRAAGRAGKANIATSKSRQYAAVADQHDAAAAEHEGAAKRGDDPSGKASAAPAVDPAKAVLPEADAPERPLRQTTAAVAKYAADQDRHAATVAAGRKARHQELTAAGLTSDEAHDHMHREDEEARRIRNLNGLSARVKAEDVTTGTAVVPASRKEAAAAAAQMMSPTGDYAFARPSNVGNVGEDLANSARHKRNEWKGLADAEASGTAAQLVTRDKLLENEPHDLLPGVAWHSHPVVTADGSTEHGTLTVPGVGVARIRSTPPKPLSAGRTLPGSIQIDTDPGTAVQVGTTTRSGYQHRDVVGTMAKLGSAGYAGDAPTPAELATAARNAAEYASGFPRAKAAAAKVEQPAAAVARDVAATEAHRYDVPPERPAGVPYGGRQAKSAGQTTHDTTLTVPEGHTIHVTTDKVRDGTYVHTVMAHRKAGPDGKGWAAREMAHPRQTDASPHDAGQMHAALVKQYADALGRKGHADVSVTGTAAPAQVPTNDPMVLVTPRGPEHMADRLRRQVTANKARAHKMYGTADPYKIMERLSGGTTGIEGKGLTMGGDWGDSTTLRVPLDVLALAADDGLPGWTRVGTQAGVVLRVKDGSPAGTTVAAYKGHGHDVAACGHKTGSGCRCPDRGMIRREVPGPCDDCRAMAAGRPEDYDADGRRLDQTLPF